MAKGRKLVSPPSRSNFIRPTSDRAREALFSIIGKQVEDSSVLDLFAGTGALGLEALSRGARHVVFADNHPVALSIIAENIKNCFHQTRDTRQNRYDDFSLNQNNDDKQPPFVTILKRDLRKKIHLPDIRFSLIFVDPPYSKGLASLCLNNILQVAMTTQRALLIIEDSISESFPESFNDFELQDQRRYGDSAFWFYRKASN